MIHVYDGHKDSSNDQLEEWTYSIFMLVSFDNVHCTLLYSYLSLKLIAACQTIRFYFYNAQYRNKANREHSVECMTLILMKLSRFVMQLKIRLANLFFSSFL